MSEEFRTTNLKEFTVGALERMDSIVTAIRQAVAGLGTMQKRAGSYSITDASGIVAAKLIPDNPSNPTLYAAFRRKKRGAKESVEKFETWVFESTVQRESFLMAEIPEYWDEDKIAGVYREFMLGSDDY